MNRDLEEQLDEMGPAYRAVVARLCAGREAEPGGRGARSSSDSRSSRNSSFSRQAYLVAASLIAAVALSVLFTQSTHHPITPSPNHPITQSTTPPRAPREYVMSVPEMLATQNPDGSWQNDFLTRRNAEALRLCAGEEARIAYKKAMRNLRARGLL